MIFKRSGVQQFTQQFYNILYDILEMFGQDYIKSFESNFENFQRIFENPLQIFKNGFWDLLLLVLGARLLLQPEEEIHFQSWTNIILQDGNAISEMELWL